MTWTAAHIATLTRLRPTGWSGSMIAAQLGGGATKNSVIGMAHRLGLDKRASPIGQPMPKSGGRKPRAPSKPKKPMPVKPRVTQPVVKLAPKPKLSREACKWPTSSSRPWTFCNLPAVAGYPYCPEHCERSYAGKSAANTGAAQRPKINPIYLVGKR